MNSAFYIEELDPIAMSSYDYSELWVIDHSTSNAEAAGSVGGRYGRGGDLLYGWGNPWVYGHEDTDAFLTNTGIGADEAFVFRIVGYPSDDPGVEALR